MVNEEKPAGSYEDEFDASRLSSGVYFYRLLTGDFVQTRKMILVKWYFVRSVWIDWMIPIN